MTARKKPYGLPPAKVTPTKRRIILLYHDELKKSFNWIAHHAPYFRDTAATHYTISKNYRIAHSKGCYHKPKRHAHNKAITEDEAQLAIADIDEGRAQTGADIQRNRFPNVAPRTVRLMLSQHGLKGFVRRQKVVLTPHNFRERLAFARTWREWAYLAGWAHYWVIFSDESKFNLNGSDGLRWYRKRKGEDPFTEQHVSQRERRGLGTGSLMVWGCITRNGVGKLHRIEGTMDRFVYMQVLEESLLSSVRDCGYEDQHWIFQQDNDPKHTARDTKQWFEEHGINVLKWPSKSPDINPIENAWAELERRITKMDPRPQTLTQLWDALNNIWYSDDFNEYAKHLYITFPHRIQKLLENNGRWLKY